MRKLTKFFVSIFAVAALALPMLCAACTPETDDGVIDYVHQVSLDFSSETKKQEVTVRLFVDGDTTHFDPVTDSKITPYNAADFADTDGYIKARYLAINTPESTGKIEPWGKKASKFTRSKLESAQSIVVESDDGNWNIDSSGSYRYLLWIWYLPEGGTEYINLNIEILQEGLALGSSAANNRYGKFALGAATQARALKLYVFSTDRDPDFPYGQATPVTLKELRCNIADYNGQKVKVEGVIAAEFNNSVYIEDLDAETGLYFGMAVYYGYGVTGTLSSVLSMGNRVSIVGIVSLYEGSGTYQISGLTYSEYNPINNSTVVSEGHEPAFAVTDAKDIVSGTVSYVVETEDENGELKIETKEIAYGEAIMDTTVTVKDLKVKSIYTTEQGSSAGAMSITCEATDGTEITIRTEVLKDENDKTITAAKYPVGTKINVKGVVDKYDGKYQVKCYVAEYIEILP
ncbi:MAG: thermonuclease family protein [Clostridiales bacterium]|nr:thermonuclease family protein [Clostridiales bacterium]